MMFQGWVKIKKNTEFWWFEKTFSRKFIFYTTEDPPELEQIYHLRYQVYCEEHSYLDKTNYPDQKESDVYDQHAVHFVLRDTINDLVACVRLVLYSEVGFPIERHFSISLHVPEENKNAVSEISRLIVAKKYRKRFLLLALIKGIFAYVRMNKIDYVYSVLDDKLFPVLFSMGFPFKKVGPPSAYQGWTTPYILSIAEMLETLDEKNPMLFRYIINGVASYNEAKNAYTIH